MSEPTAATLRPLTPEDLERVVEIDAEAGGRPRRRFFEKRLAAALKHRDGFIALAVDADGALQGFAIARLQNGEFGEDQKMAILDVIGVAPSHQNAGIGRQLLDGFAGYMEKRGVGEIRTQVDWQDRALVSFFAAAGFSLAPHQVLERASDRQL